MAKGKGLGQNPVEAHRKQQKAKEFKRNKEQKNKAKETATIKKDIGGLEAEVRRLSQEESAGTLDKPSLARLTELRAEITKIKAVKDAYLAAHPEHRNLVYKERPSASSSKVPVDEGRGPTFDRRGRLRDPKRSVYYDELLNPFGVPPPGMPYRERSLPPDEEEESEEDDSDDEIVMPEGPPPDSDSDSDDSIVMPDGPPPPQAKLHPASGEASGSGTSGMGLLPPGAPPTRPPFRPFNAARPPFNPNFSRPPFPPQHGNFPQQSGFQPGPHFQSPFGQMQQYPPPPPPPGFFPPGGATITSMPSRPYMPNHQARPMQAGAMHDPLSNSPHQAFQARRAEHAAAAGLPQKPGSISQNGNATASTSAPPASAVISAEPQLRDLRQEVKAFVPRGVKRKKVIAGPGVEESTGNGPAEDQGDTNSSDRKRSIAINSAPMVISAAPQTESTTSAQASSASGGGLLGKLSSVLGLSPAEQADIQRRQGAETKDRAETKQGDDYRAFLEGLGELK